MFSVDSDIISANDVYDCLEVLYKNRLSNRGGISSALAIDEYVSWIEIDGVRINIDQDYAENITTIYPEHEGPGEEYIKEIVDYFNNNNENL